MFQGKEPRILCLVPAPLMAVMKAAETGELKLGKVEGGGPGTKDARQPPLYLKQHELPRSKLRGIEPDSD